MKRKFKLVNSLKEELFLDGSTGILAVDPEGLGISFKNEYDQEGSRFRLLSRSLEMAEFKVEIVSGVRKGYKPYEVFDSLIAFLNYPPLKLVYQIDTGEYWRNIVLKDLPKTEINFAGNIKEPVTFECTSYWLNEKYQLIPRLHYVEGTGKVYGKSTYPYIYGVNFDELRKAIKLENHSVFISDISKRNASPIEITIHGPCTNPAWSIYKDSELFADDRYFVNVPEGAKLVVNSSIENTKAVIVNNDGTESSVYPQQDHKKTNFVTVPNGISYLVFQVGSASAEYRFYEERGIV